MKKRSAMTVERPRVARGLAAAAIVSWTLLVPLPTIADMAQSRWWEPWWRPPIIWPALFEAYAIVGLLIAFLFCFAVGIPAWVVASAWDLRRRRDAALIGALCGVVLDLLLLGLFGLTSKGPPHYDPFTRILFLPVTIGVYIVVVAALAGLVARRAAGIRAVVRKDMARLFA